MKDSPRARGNPRALGTNARARGTNPRALGNQSSCSQHHPRALGINPRALGTNPRARRCEHCGGDHDGVMVVKRVMVTYERHRGDCPMLGELPRGVAGHN
jgi:hypothetical protein